MTRALYQAVEPSWTGPLRTFPIMTPTGPSEPGATRWLDAVDFEQLKRDRSAEVVIEESVLAVFWHNERIWAIDAICAHHGGPIAKGRVVDETVTCPWHGWCYRLGDGVNIANGQAMLQTYPTRIEAGRVQVGLSLES